MRWGGDGAELSRLVLEIDATLRDALRALDMGAEAIVFVREPQTHRVIGAITDGDLRRALLRGCDMDSTSVNEAMRRDFSWVPPEAGRAEVLDLMRARRIGQLPILDADGRLCGLHTIGRMLMAEPRPNAAVILAGGRGTRLGPLTRTIPKPMVTVAGRPILERLLLHLMGCGIRRFYISVNYLASVIEDHFGDGTRFGCEITYLREDQPLGTGGPLAQLTNERAHPVVVLNGDLITQCDVGGLLDFHAAGDYVATIGVREYIVEIPFGTAKVVADRLVALREKPVERQLVNAGIYVLSSSAIDMIPPGQEYPITSLFERCLVEGRPVGAFQVTDEWIDVGRPEELRRARGLS